MRLFLRAAGLALGAVVAAWATPACYTAGGGSAPPLNSFYFPTGLAVSSGGNVLYAINSDFDLQWSGGTLQSYDLFRIRLDAATLIRANLPKADGTRDQDAIDAASANIPFVDKPWSPDACLQGQPPGPASNGRGVYLGQACAPPIDSSQYVRGSVVVGAFATDLQLNVTQSTAPGGASSSSSLATAATRLFAPVGGNATVTWADVKPDDDPNAIPDASFAPFQIDCGVQSDGRCDANHQTGNDPNSLKNSRNWTMPGEPFGLAQSEDGAALAVTSETDTKTSLLTTGFGNSAEIADQPTMQFVVDGLPVGGVGIAAVPHDKLAVRRCEDHGNAPPCVRQAFLQTNRNVNEVDLLRYYDDDGSSLRRPFLVKEASFGITANSSGTDSRGIAIDATPRIACEKAATSDDEKLACAQLSANVFIANRAPSSIVVGQLGQVLEDGTYDPDRLVITGNVPLTDGPSNVYLAPIVDKQGRYELRLFVVCYDTQSVFIFDPKDVVAGVAVPLGIVFTGQGPYAVAFDPFSVDDVANGNLVPGDARPAPPDRPKGPADLGLNRYRFMYVASFRESYVQVIDLDESNPVTFQHVVFTLGQPTAPKGT